MKIKKVVLAGGLTGFYTDDKLAILNDAPQDGLDHRGKPATPGFKQIRQPGESVLVMLLLEDGSIALGDCAGTKYSGAGGREPPFSSAAAIPIMETHVVPKLVGREFGDFRTASAEMDTILADRKPLHPAIRYGVTQAVLDAIAIGKARTKASIVAEEYGTTIAKKPIKLYAQTGDERYTNVDKMILKRIDILPHGLINNVRDKVGAKGEKFVEYVQWVSNRVKTLGEPGHAPELHFDTYGTLGHAMSNDIEKVADLLGQCVKAAEPFNFIVEMPIDLGSKPAQLEGMKKLKGLLRNKGIKAELMIDEWCSSLDDLKEWGKIPGATDRINVKTIVLGGITTSWSRSSTVTSMVSAPWSAVPATKLTFRRWRCRIWRWRPARNPSPGARGWASTRA